MRKHNHFSMLPLLAFRPSCGRMTLWSSGGDTPAAPDYTPVAAASEESARIAAKLGEEQLAESKRQYENNIAVSKPIVEKQAALMDQQISQGDDYYNYAKSISRPAETAMFTEAMGGGVSAADQAQEDNASSTALADARVGTTQNQNQLIRQGLRYGMSPERLAAAGGLASVDATKAAIAGSNAARTQQKAIAWGKKSDVSNAVKGLTGTSQNAYSLANSSGNSAVANTAQAGNSLVNGLSSGTSTIMTGQGQKVSGLSSILGSQTSLYNSNQPTDNTGSLIGAAAGLGAAFISDRRLKENIELVGSDEDTGLNIYEFNYIGEPSYRFSGVMADEVEKIIPAAVMRDKNGFASVNYEMLGIEMKEV